MQLGLKFPKADGATPIIDTALYEPASLTPGPHASGPYPLVVRLETITPKGLADGHTLQVRHCPHATLEAALKPCPMNP